MLPPSVGVKLMLDDLPVVLETGRCTVPALSRRVYSRRPGYTVKDCIHTLDTTFRLLECLFHERKLIFFFYSSTTAQLFRGSIGTWKRGGSVGVPTKGVMCTPYFFLIHDNVRHFVLGWGG